MEKFRSQKVNFKESNIVNSSLYIVDNNIPIQNSPKYKLIINKKKNRRPIHSNKKFKINENFSMISHNVASLKSKFLSFAKVLADLKPKLWALQETHMQVSGKSNFKVPMHIKYMN